jgi:hypothetical protein
MVEKSVCVMVVCSVERLVLSEKMKVELLVSATAVWLVATKVDGTAQQPAGLTGSTKDRQLGTQ